MLTRAELEQQIQTQDAVMRQIRTAFMLMVASWPHGDPRDPEWLAFSSAILFGGDESEDALLALRYQYVCQQIDHLILKVLGECQEMGLTTDELIALPWEQPEVE